MEMENKIKIILKRIKERVRIKKRQIGKIKKY